MTTQPDDTTRWIDQQGDIWTLGNDGLMHTPETAPFSREHVEKKWGPLKPAATQPAGEHHTGTLNLTGEGNAPANPIPHAAVTALATHLAWSASWDTYSEETQNTLIACTLPTALAALEAAYPAIRQQVAEEIAAAIEASEDRANEASRREGIAGNRGTARAWDDIATGYMRSAELAREVGGTNSPGIIGQQVTEQIIAAIAERRAEITPGRPGWGYFSEAIDIAKRIGGVA